MTIRPSATPMYIPTLEDSPSGLASPRLVPAALPREDLLSSWMSLLVMITGMGLLHLGSLPDQYL